MKSRTLRKIIAATTLVLGVAISVTSSLSWFDETVKIETENVTGVSEGAYFHSGNGTKDYPYTITRKRHLYNLAWLQYLGYFATKDSSGNMSGKQNTVYFRLLNDVDMDGMNIPPIGTSEYPFIGNFDGQGYKVTNFTSTNDYSDFTGEGQKHPYTVTTENFKNNQVKIVGFFGVVGSIGDSSNYTYDSEKNQVKNVGLNNFEVKSKATDTLVGLAAGYVNGELASVAVNNGKLNLTSSAATTALDSTNLTSNVSDYSIVGYATDPYKTKVTKVSQSAYKVTRAVNQEFVVEEEGDENAYGSSIDMRSVTKRLQTIRENYGVQTNFPYYINYDYHSGVKDANPTTVYSDTNRYTRLYNSNDNWGHFNFITDNSPYSENGTNVASRYALLGGGHYERERYYELSDRDSFKISNGTYYMVATNNNNFNRTTDEASATNFSLDNTGLLQYTYNGTKYYLYAYSNTVLRASPNQNDATPWRMQDDGNTRYLYSVYKGNYVALNYNTNANNAPYWNLSSITVDTKYAIGFQNTGNYLINNGTNGLRNSTTKQYIWTFSNQSGSTNIYTTVNNNTYYLTINVQQSGNWTTTYTNTLALQRNNASSWNRTSNGNFEYLYQNKAVSSSWSWISGTNTTYADFYVSFLGSSWELSQTTTSATLIIEGKTQFSGNSNIAITDITHEEKVGPDEVLDKVEGKMVYSKDSKDVTYFPLSTVNNTNNFAPIKKNTAYVVAGTDIKQDTTSYSDELTQVRFGYYPSADNYGNAHLKNVSNKKFTTLYTINATYNQSTGTYTYSKDPISSTNSLKRYTNAKEGMEKVLATDATKYYGLHFMEASISEDATYYAPSVTVNQHTYTNYELPINSIDFHLKEFGYVNFIAGTYYNAVQQSGKRNNSFFSLYQIERTTENPKDINRIIEIKKVYKYDDGSGVENEAISNVYELEYNGATFYTRPYKVIDNAGTKKWLYTAQGESDAYRINQYVDSLPENYTLAFDVARIKGNNLNSSTFDYYAYYFEIPMNDGEFCLGSVEGYVGSYLMYLDIAANAQNIARSVFTEYFLRTDEEFDFPIGVAVVSDVAIINTHTETTDQKVYASDSVTIVIKPGYKDELILSRDTSGGILTRSTTSSLAAPSYKEASLSLKENGTEVTEFEATRTTQYETIRNIIVDRDTRLQTTTITVIEENYIDGVSDGRTVNQYSESIAEANLIPAADRKYYQLDPIKSTGKAIEESALEIIQPDKTNVLITYTYLMQDGSTSTNTFVLDFTKETDTNYYTTNGYTISVTLTPAEDSSDTLVMTVTVLNKNGEVISINNITINGTGPVA